MGENVSGVNNTNTQGFQMPSLKLSTKKETENEEVLNFGKIDLNKNDDIQKSTIFDKFEEMKENKNTSFGWKEMLERKQELRAGVGQSELASDDTQQKP